jgi:hypothetical protein
MNSIEESLSGENSGFRQPGMEANERSSIRVACAWCGEVIEEGSGPVSHGMCPKCHAAFLATMPGV